MTHDWTITSDFGTIEGNNLPSICKRMGELLGSSPVALVTIVDPDGDEFHAEVDFSDRRRACRQIWRESADIAGITDDVMPEARCY